MDRGIPSHGFPTQPYVSTQDNFELSGGVTSTQSSQDFTTPSGFPNDFVSASKGGTFHNLVKYSEGFAPTLDTHLVYKGWVEEQILAAITDVEEGNLSQVTIRGWFSSADNDGPLNYNNSSGVFTLDENLSSYTNDIGFLTEFVESDPIFSASAAANVTAQKITNWDSAFGWGNHAGLYRPVAWVPTWTDVTGKPTTFTPSAHTHLITEISDSTTVGENLVKLTNPSAIRFLRINADNTVSTLSAADFRTAIGAGSSSATGTVTSVAMTVPTGLSISGTPITTSGTLALSLSAGYSIPTTVKQGQWDTAYGWGDHGSEGYLTEVTEADVTAHEAALSIASTQITGLTVPEELGDLSDFPATTAASRVFRRNSANTAYEFATLVHSDIGNLDSTSTHVHLTQAQKDIAVRAATSFVSGYMTATHVQALEAALTEFTPGNLLSFTGSTLNVDDTVKPVGDTETSADYTWSAEKILSMFTGSVEDGGYAKSYTITIPAGADLATKLRFGATGPTGWTYSATGGSSGDLQITHSFGKTPASIGVYRVNADSTKSKLEGATAYGDAKSTTSDTILILSSYANTSLETEIRIIF